MEQVVEGKIDLSIEKWLKPISKLMKYGTVSQIYRDFVEEFYYSVPSILHKSSSSTGKYHKDFEGNVPDILDHTLEMMSGIIGMKDSIARQYDVTTYQMLMAAAAIHDALKYGWNPGEHTVSNHPELAGRHVLEFAKSHLLGKDKNVIRMMAATVAYHSGPWTPNVRKPEFFGYPFNLVHTMDMLSARGVLRNMYKELLNA